MRPKYFYTYLFMLLLLGGLTGCATAPPPPTPTPALSAAEIVTRSSEKMMEVKTLHYTIDLSGVLDYIDRPPTTALKHVEGDLLRPDRVRGLVKVSSFGIVSEIGLISIEGDSYVTNPLNQRWEKLPPEWGWYFDPRLPFDETYGIPAVAPTIPMEKKGIEEIEGQNYYHLEGTTPAEPIMWWTAGMIREGEVPVSLWIETDTFLIARVRLVELASHAERPTTWDIRFSNYDAPLEIEPPPIGEKKGEK